MSPGAGVSRPRARRRSPDQQVLGVLLLDASCRLIGDAEIFRGVLTAAAVEPRAVFRRALAASAGSTRL